jgi:hypothetical protein
MGNKVSTHNKLLLRFFLLFFLFSYVCGSLLVTAWEKKQQHTQRKRNERKRSWSMYEGKERKGARDVPLPAFRPAGRCLRSQPGSTW